LKKFNLKQRVRGLVEYFKSLEKKIEVIRDISKIHSIGEIFNPKITKKLIKNADYVLTIQESHLFERVEMINLNRIEKLINYLKWEKDKFRSNNVKTGISEEVDFF
jgi:uncharacterized pyridoxal phosphate-containing UPF0001 family protein